MRILPTQCPFTGGPLVVTQLYSPEGDLTIDGRFRIDSPFLNLTPPQMEFVLTFIQCEGKFNRMQEALNLSYPTLRARLREIIRALGLKTDDAAAVAQEAHALSARRQILCQVDAGAMSVPEALARLRDD